MFKYLLGGRHIAPERYDAAFYARFRDQSTISAAHQFAREGNVDALSVMFTYHGQDTLPHRLAILANMKPTLGPYDFRYLH